MEGNGHQTPEDPPAEAADEEATGRTAGATLDLTPDQSQWLSDHLEGVVRAAPVNTEPMAHQIVSKLHQQGY